MSNGNEKSTRRSLREPAGGRPDQTGRSATPASPWTGPAPSGAARSDDSVDLPQRGDAARELGLLSEIERDPDATQAGLAVKLGVAVGTVNWHLKRMVAKGYVKVRRAERRKLVYLITPSGLALRARLTVAYVENSMALYREIRKDARRALAQARRQGYDRVRIEGNGDIADVCRLTCLEMGFSVEPKEAPASGAAVLRVDGRKVRLAGTRKEER